MRILSRIVYIGLGSVLVLAIVGVMLPKQVHVERNLRIDASAQDLFPYINDFRLFNQWSPWARRDPDIRYEFDGPTAGEGATMRWQSDHPEVGSGRQTIIQSEPPYRVRTELDFGQSGQARSFMRLEPDSGATRVTWGLDINFGMDLVGRYFGLMMDDWVGGDYETGLTNLKELVENRPAPAS